MTIGEAVKTGFVNNETLGYYMARTQLFLVTSGIILEKLRFRCSVLNQLTGLDAVD